MESFVANLLGQGKKTTLKGREYFVAPMTLICPGVLNGSRGPLLYPSDEIAKSYKSWNGVPLVVDHPVRDGRPISAKEVVEDHVGFIKNSRVKDGKLQADGWFDIENLKRVNEAVWTRLENNEPIELSTGLQTSNEEVQPGTTFNGVLYSHVARNHRPDHLAVLPTARGACSLNDGCGVLVNEQEGVETELCTNCDASGECEACKAKRMKKMKATEPVENEESQTENCGGEGGTPGPCKKTVTIQGDTYKAREKLKEEGFKWDPDTKTWSRVMTHGVHKTLGEGFYDDKGNFKDTLKGLSHMVKTYAKSDKFSIDITEPTTNELSHDDLRTRLTQLLNERYGTPSPSVFGVSNPIPANNLWINDVFDKDFVYQDGPEQYRLGYKTDLRNDTVTLSDEAPVQVTVKKSYVANEQREFLKTLNCKGTGKPGPCKIHGAEGHPSVSTHPFAVHGHNDDGSESMLSSHRTAEDAALAAKEAKKHLGKKTSVVSRQVTQTNQKKQTHNVGLKLVVNSLRKEADMVVNYNDCHDGLGMFCHTGSASAASASRAANKSGTKSAHRIAATEHKKAAAFHKEEGNDDLAALHLATAKLHAKAGRHTSSRKGRQTTNQGHIGSHFQGVPTMATGKLSDADRQKLVDGLVENSGFETADTWEEDDREVLNAMSDEKLYGLAVAKQTLIDQQSVVNAVGRHVGQHALEDLPEAVENAFKPFKKKSKMDDEEDAADNGDDEEAEGETMNMDNHIRVPRQLTEAEFMKMAPPSIRQDLEYSRAVQNKEKQELIGTITANVSGDELDQAVNYLRTKPLPELRIIANVASKPAAPEYDVNVRRSPNYGGMAVPSQSRMTTNKRPGEGPRPVTIPWGEISKQA